MKKIKKKLFTGLLAVLGGVVFSFGVACGEKKVEYTFDVAGGNAISAESVKQGETYELPTAKRDGYRFMGWYTNANYTGDAVVSVVASENATYYAKWEKLYTVTLNANGGQLSGGVTSVQLIAKENIYEAVKNIQPTKDGLQFGEWFNGNVPLATSLGMPTQDITLTAKYKAAYTVKFQDAHDEKIADDVEEYAYVGAAIDAQYSLKGYTEIGRSPLDDLIVSETVADNVIVLIYEANDITVNFYPNYPDGDLGDNAPVSVKYGQTVELLADYETEGYCLIGWATERNGEVKYAVDSVSNKLMGGETVDAKTFTPDETVSLFGVWQQGYRDAFTGSDYLFVFDENSDDIYMYRAGKYFKGTLYSDDKEFYFATLDGINGRLYDDYTFLYAVSSRALYTYILYLSPLKGVDENTTIRFDDYDTITYRVKGVGESVGRYKVNDDGSIVATFTSGELNGKKLTMNLGYVNGEHAFQIRNDAEMMDLTCFTVVDGKVYPYKTEYYALTLNGFGTATLTNNEKKGSYVYEINGDTITLYTSTTMQVAGVAKMMEYGGYKGYMLYTEALDGTFDLGNGASLTLDGLRVFTYTTASQQISGFYSAEQSFLGGVLVKVFDTSGETPQTHLFHFTQTTEGEETKINVVEKPNTYAELLYKAEVTENGTAKIGMYYAPLFVLGEGEEDNMATVYGLTKDSVFVKKLYGSYAYDAVSGRYTFTALEITDAEVIEVAGVDLNKVKSFVFAMDTTSYTYKIHFWYSYVSTDNTPVSFAEMYTSGEKQLSLIAGSVVYSDGTTTKVGQYAKTENYLTVVFSGASEYTYFLLTESEGGNTFEELLYLPYQIKRVNANGSLSTTDYIAFDGKGGATYYTESGSYVGSVQAGKVETSAGTFVSYCFTSADGTFTVTYVLNGSGQRYYLENNAYSGRYMSTDGILTLDGFGATAKFTDAKNKTSTSVYEVVNTNFLRIYVNNAVRYVELNADKTFRLLDAEYGEHRVVDNQKLTGTYINFDGKGGFTSYVKVGETQSNVKEGTYVTVDGEVTMTFADGSVWVGFSSSALIENTYGYIFTLVDQDMKKTYVNETDWSVLVLDGKGNATKYTTTGLKDSGAYIMLDTDLLFFINSASTDAYIYQLDGDTATPPTRSAEVGYYTANFETLVFTQFGYAVFNGETQYFFHEKANGDVYIYRPVEDGEDTTGLTVTEYGYVKILFGKFNSSSIKWEEKDYFPASKYDVSFVRQGNGETTATDYPYPFSEDENVDLTDLVFAPTGETFAVEGTAYFSNGQSTACVVVREIVDGKAETFFVIGNYRYDVTLTYGGRNVEDETPKSTYVITRARYMMEVVSYQYLDISYLLLSNGISQKLDNSFGIMRFYYEIDKTGVKGDMYADGEYFEGSGMEAYSFTKARARQDKSGLFIVTLTAADNQTYRIYCGLRKHSGMKQTGYTIVAFVRVQTFALDGGYVLTVGRLIKTELDASMGMTITAGMVYEADVLKDGVSVVPENADVKLIPINETCVYFVVREKGEGGSYTAITYYVARFTEEVNSSVTENKVVMPYATATLEKLTAIRVFTSSGSEFVEIAGEGENRTILYMFYGVNGYDVAECTQNGNVFVITATTGEVFEVVIEDGVLKNVTEVYQEA